MWTLKREYGGAIGEKRRCSEITGSDTSRGDGLEMDKYTPRGNTRVEGRSIVTT